MPKRPWVPMRSIATLLLSLAGIAAAGPLRLIDMIPNPGAEAGESLFGRALDWDDTEILVGAYPSVRVFDSVTRAHKYRLGESVVLPSGFNLGSAVIMTPDHFVTVASRVNAREIVYVFRRHDGALEKTIAAPPGANNTPGFGADFALSGNRLFVSILHSSPNSGDTPIGGVHVYDIRNWSLEAQTFRPPDGVWFDGFGGSIAVEGNILAVGAARKDSFSGAAYLFDATSRALIAKVQTPVPASDQWFGTSVLLRNGKLYVTSRSAVWEYEAATGNYLGKFAPVPAAGYYDWFGSDVEIVGDELLAVWSSKTLYQFDTSTRQQVAALRSPLDSGTSSTSPGRMKARGDILLTGASGGTDPATRNGAVLAFTNVILDPVVQIADATGSEAERGVTVRITVDPPPTREVTVDYETREDSARAGMDFVARSGTVTIPAGTATAELKIEVLDDTGTEPMERLFLDILSGTGAIITPGEVELWIRDDDPSFQVPVGTNAELPLASFPGDELGTILTASGNTAYVACKDLAEGGDLRGGVFVVDLMSRDITPLAPAGFESGARFGCGLAVDHELLAVGAVKSRDNPGVPAIYVYDRKSLSERMILRPPTSDAIGFGEQIAIGAKHILVGLPFEDRRGFQVGDVLVYDRASGAFLSRIESPTGNLGGRFGAAVAFSAGRALIGATGRVYCFDLDDQNRLLFEVERGTRDTAHIQSDFGKFLQANERYIAVGNPWDDSFRANSGSVLVYDATTGAHLHTIREASGGFNLNFGTSISLMGNVLAVAGTRAGISLMDIATGHELIDFAVSNSLVASGFRQTVALTSGHVVAGLPWGRANYHGRVISFRRDGIELEVTAAPRIDRQTGLMVGKIMVSNRFPIPAQGLRIYVRGLAPGATLINAAGTGGPDSLSYLLYNQALAGGASVELTVEFYVPDRGSVGSLTYESEWLTTPEPPVEAAASGAAPDQVVRLADGSMMIDFGVEAGKSYRVEYSSTGSAWMPAGSEMKALSNRLRWIDNGPPKTERHPSEAPARFYRLVSPTSPP